MSLTKKSLQWLFKQGRINLCATCKHVRQLERQTLYSTMKCAFHNVELIESTVENLVATKMIKVDVVGMDDGGQGYVIKDCQSYVSE